VTSSLRPPSDESGDGGGQPRVWSEAGAAAIDKAGRLRAVDPRFNVALQASAGTGKTRVLVERYVNLLKAGVDPANVLAITFTRKAAAEMRERIVARLRAAALEGEVSPARWNELRDRLGDISISTIDAFCLSLLREFPLEADVDPGFRMADDTEVLRLVDESLDRTFRVCRSLAREDEHLALVLAQLGERRTRRGLAALLGRRLVAPSLLDRFLASGPSDLTTAAAGERVSGAIRDALGATAGGIDAFFEHGPLVPAFALLRNTVEDNRPEMVPVLVSRVRNYFLTQDGQPRRRLTATKADFASLDDWRCHRDAVVGQAEVVARALARHRHDLNAVMSRGVRRMFEVAREEYRRTLDAHAVVDFSDVLLRALGLLRRMDEFSQSRFRLESRYHHILVDEFQDTSRAQWELVSLLVRAWGEGSGLAYTGPLQPTVFVVGDPKQSIYGFRDADASILDDAARLLQGLRPDGDVRHAISRSHRSVPALLAFVNDVCGAMALSPVRRDAFRYDIADRFPVDPTEDSVAPERSDALGLVAGATAAICAARAAGEIARLLEEGTVRDRDTGAARPVRPGDVAILFRSRDSHREFEQALTARGIPAYVYKGLGFFDSDEIKDVLALLWFLADPTSDLRSAAWLRSRVVGITDAALRRLAPRIADAVTLPTPPDAAGGLDEVDAARFARARAGAARWLPLVDRLPPAELLDHVLRDAAYMAETRGARLGQARENLKKIRAMVRRIQNRGYLTFAQLTDYIDRLSLGDESSAVIDALDAVHLMTVHASKGLEFPVVWVVNIARGTGQRRDPIRVSADGEGHEPASVAVGDFQSDADEQQGAKDREETRRLVYVALTRARDRLYLASVLKDGVLRAGRGSLAAVLPPDLVSLFGAAGEGVEGGASLTWHPPSGVEHRLVIRADDFPAASAASGEPAGGGPLPGGDDFSPLLDMASHTAVTARISVALQPRAAQLDAESDRRLGVVLHRLLERCGLDTTPDEARVGPLVLELLGPDDAPPEAAGRATLVRRATRAYLDLCARADVRALLEAGEPFFEVPFSLQDASVMVRGTIDCLVRRPDGGVSVLEFKTGARRPEHLEQLNLYHRAATLLFPGAQVDEHLVYTRVGTW